MVRQLLSWDSGPPCQDPFKLHQLIKHCCAWQQSAAYPLKKSSFQFLCVYDHASTVCQVQVVQLFRPTKTENKKNCYTEIWWRTGLKCTLWTNRWQGREQGRKVLLFLIKLSATFFIFRQIILQGLDQRINLGLRWRIFQRIREQRKTLK